MGAFFITYYILVLIMNFIRKLIIKTTWGPYWVMYDNECGLCYAITRFFKKFDMFDKIQWVDKNWTGDFPDEGRKQIEKTVVVFNPSNNKLYYKTRAVSKIILCVPFGFLLSFIGLAINSYLTYNWIYFNYLVSPSINFTMNRPLLFFGILTLIIGFQLISIGLIGELIVKYYKKNDVTDYSIDE